MTEQTHSVHLGAIVRDVLEAVVLAVVLFLLLRLVVQNTVVEGPSMQPNLVNGQWVLVSRLSYRRHGPERGDVIVFDAPDGSGKEFIKRVIALQGEIVSIRGGVVSIDGQAVAEPWMPNLDDSAFGPYEVPEGSVFVLGDNRPFSNDSRSWASTNSALARNRIVGKAWMSIWPIGRFGVIRSDRPAPDAQTAASVP
jgi:signal peptidase I